MASLVVVCAIVAQPACAKDPTAPTEIYLNVASTLAVDRVVLTARTLEGLTDVIERPVTDRDITIDTLPIRLTPAPGFSLDFLLIGEGYLDDVRLVANAQEMAFAEHDRRDLELDLNEGFAEDDFDRDGYRLCGTGTDEETATCDCDDLDAAVNPFEIEICGNGVDDDCTGVVDDGC